MTANEMADYLESMADDVGHEGYHRYALVLKFEAPQLIRQQQAEIEALKLRELSDEEIIATFNYFCVFKDESESTIHNPKYFEEQMILYARLILETASRKASEK